jgi:hypothetical protein
MPSSRDSWWGRIKDERSRTLQGRELGTGAAAATGEDTYWYGGEDGYRSMVMRRRCAVREEAGGDVR